MVRRGEIEEVLKRIFFGGDKADYVVYIKHRIGKDEVLQPIPGEAIRDVRRGYIYVGEDTVIPYHRVVEVRRKNGELVYKRG